MKGNPVKILLIIVYLGLSISLPAQNSFYKISLTDKEIKLSLKGYYVENVINAQYEDTIIGFVQTGMFNHKRAASFNSSISGEFQSLLREALPDTAGAIPLIIRINKVYIYEITTSSSETAFADLNISFIRRDGRDYYHMFDAGTSITKGGMDVTHSHAGNIINALEACFSDFAEAIRSSRVENSKIPETVLYSNPLDHHEMYPVFHDGKLSKGVFHTFYDFRDARPDTTVRFQIHYQPSKNDTLVTKARLSWPALDIPTPMWGFSDGNGIYMKIDKNYFLLHRDKNEFISYVGYKDISLGVGTGAIIVTAGILGGLVGAVIAAAAVSATKSATKQKSTGSIFKVDFCNGALAPVQFPDFLRTEASVTFFLSKATAKDISVCLYIDNEFHASLTRGKYYLLHLSPRKKHFTLKAVSSSGVTDEEVFPATVFNNDIYLIRVKGDKSISVTSLFGDVRSDIERDMNDESVLTRSEPGTEIPCHIN